MIPAENPAILSVSISNGMTVKIRLGLKEIRIGRSKEADLLLHDPSVSRIHARIFRVGDQYFLSDSSRNGTYVDGKRISQVQLEGGLSFRIGPYHILFSREGRSHSSSKGRPAAGRNWSPGESTKRLRGKTVPSWSSTAERSPRN